MARKLNVAIIGLGGIGSTHAKILSQMKEVNLAALCDVDKAKSEVLARHYGAQAFTDYKELYDRVPLDAVFIATPNALHTEPVLMAIEREINVFSEKPMDVSLNKAKKIVEAVEKKGIIYQVGFNRRFTPAYKKVKELIQGLSAPPLLLIKMNRGELKTPSWVGNPKISGGFLYESTIHVFDILRFFYGEIKSVKCQAWSSYYKNQFDDFIIEFTLKNSSRAVIISSAHTSWIFPFERIEIFGDHWAIETQEFNLARYSPGLGSPTQTWEFSTLPKEVSWGYLEEDRRFVNTLLKGGRPPVTHKDGYRSVELVEACYKSTKEGKEISLPLLESSLISD